MTAVRQHVYLIPGFFGFANLGELVYFGHAHDFVSAELARRGINAQVTVVHSHPTAALRTRARDLLQVILDTASNDSGPIHLIGHSTGGLDARLLVSSPGSLGDDLPGGLIASRIRSIVTVSTPHHGTPLASFFSGLLGPPMLQLLSLLTVYVLRFGRIPLPILLKIGGLMTQVGTLGGTRSLFDQVFSQLLSDFSPPRQAALTQFFRDVNSDQRLIPQLTPEAMEVFNAATPNQPGVRYASVVSQARRPNLRSRWAVGLHPYPQLTHTLFALLYRQSSRVPVDRIPVQTTPEQAAALQRAFGKLPRFRACDGIVPTLSQPWGEVIHGAWADHLDTIGHFDDPQQTPPHVDWLLSGSGFKRPDFEALWGSVVRYLFT